jgi:O-glycosyl hydrolase
VCIQLVNVPIRRKEVKEELREAIRKQVGIVPISVQNGSVQNVVRWKEQATQAISVANNPKSTEHQLKITLAGLTRTA